MPRLHELAREDVPLDSPPGWQAVISKGATDLDDLVKVKIPALDNDEWDGVRWMPRTVGDPLAVQMPSRGDGCVVVFDEDGDPQIVVWWPT